MATGTVIKESSKIKIKEPKKYKVVMHNDDFTSMEFVVFVLKDIFKKSHEDAMTIMMTVHKGGKAVVGTYSYDVAKSKVEITTKLARDEGFPFKLTVEEA